MTGADAFGTGDGGVYGSEMRNVISGGVFLDTVVQARQVTLQQSRQGIPALCGLPAPSPTFTGREAALAGLDEVLRPQGVATRFVPVAVVAGLGGVGKTELVVQAAQRAFRSHGWFPGGVLFVDLHGDDRRHRLAPSRALELLLRALGVSDDQMPAGLEERSQLYRSVLTSHAERRGRVLVVLDNAGTSEQVRPLLPSDPDVATLVTSRRTLADLVNARLIELRALDGRDSVGLLRDAIRHARPGDTRVDEELREATNIARFCGHLPLALRIVSALLAEFPQRPLASIAHNLADTDRRLDRLKHGDMHVRAAFDLSYQQLSQEHARALRLLARHPGPDICTESAAILLSAHQDGDSDDSEHSDGRSYDGVERILEDLARSHLIETGSEYGRWRLHDLVRLFAHELAESDDSGMEGMTALLSHLIGVAYDATTHLRSERAPATRFETLKQALKWLDTEYPNLMAFAPVAPTLPHARLSFALLVALEDYLEHRRLYGDWVEFAKSALGSTGLDPLSEFWAQHTLGHALLNVGRYEETVAAATRTRVICHERQDWRGVSMAEQQLASALGSLGRHDDAIEAHRRALLTRQGLEQDAEAAALHYFAGTLASADRLTEAVEAEKLSLELWRELGEHRRTAKVLCALGDMYGKIGQLEESLSCCREGFSLLQELGDRREAAVAQYRLAVAFGRLDRGEEMVDAFAGAAELWHEAGDPPARAVALHSLGVTLRITGRPVEAIRAHREGLTVGEELGDKRTQSEALMGLGLALADACDEADEGSGSEESERENEAVDAFMRSAALLREWGDREEAAATLNTAARYLRHLGRAQEADEVSEQAASLLSGDR
ncbi:tetratricopeptide repeat protein [Streptomyces tubercidicus]|uniref:tetratricopeptide repeat protein n=1 Tax=Streptomyces tubercidicus TaxID=47759 RepID=UPI002E18E5EA